MKNTPFVFLILIFISALQVHGQKNAVVTPENALVSYLENGDNSFKWKVQEEFQAENLTLYRLIFTSQTWRDIEWNHELTILVPDKLLFNDALLFITGGSVKNGSPYTHAWDDDMIVTMGEVAKQNKAMTAIIWQVPNQPLYNDLTEDALISFTLHNYQNDKDLTWPLLFPMTKSAIRAIDRKSVV